MNSKMAKKTSETVLIAVFAALTFTLKKYLTSTLYLHRGHLEG